MPAYSYRTVQSESRGLYKDKGSKFLAFVYPVELEKEIKDRIEGLKKEYFDARHHCYAWILGAEKKHFRSFDDGEPNHSAGDPILGQIRSKDLTNVLVVVVRYFGGVKLGVGGLITAYKAAAEEALLQASIIEKQVLKPLILTYDYSGTPEVMRLVKEFNLIIKDQRFENDCRLTVDYALEVETELLDKIKLLNSTGHSVQTSEG